jgi:tRNA (guanine-N(7)-)-methyltransferase
MSAKPEPRKLKPAQHRIVLRDGTELQFHNPLKPAEPVHLQQMIPTDWKGTLEIEIGPGKGEFLARRAAAHPERNFVGIDRRMDRFKLTEKKLDRATEGKNWIVIREDARRFLEAGLPPVQVLHVYQPDPWPKSRHHKHRFFRSPDARRWAEAIVKGGELRFSTDHREYFEEIVEIVLSWGFLRPAFILEKRAGLSDPSTHFEGIFLKKNLPVWKAVFVRT